jgi:Arc/MetJ-type ribon-helix-helix transcriptional regulator
MIRGMPKARLSVTVDAQLLDLLDAQVGTGRPFSTRSAAAEAAIRSLLRARRVREMESYYAEQPEEEREDELSWARAGARMLADRLEAEDGE